MSKKWGSKPWRVWASHWKKKDAIGSLRLPLALIVSVIIGCGGGYLIINKFSNWRNWQAFDPQNEHRQSHSSDTLDDYTICNTVFLLPNGSITRNER